MVLKSVSTHYSIMYRTAKEWASGGTTTRKRETIYIGTTKPTKKNQARYKRRTTLIGRVDDTQE
jgi:hypothetical protein